MACIGWKRGLKVLKVARISPNSCRSLQSLFQTRIAHTAALPLSARLQALLFENPYSKLISGSLNGRHMLRYCRAVKSRPIPLHASESMKSLIIATLATLAIAQSSTSAMTSESTSAMAISSMSAMTVSAPASISTAEYSITALPAVIAQANCVWNCLIPIGLADPSGCDDVTNECACLSAPADVLDVLTGCISTVCTESKSAYAASATSLYESYCTSAFGSMQFAMAFTAAASADAASSSMAAASASSASTAPSSGSASASATATGSSAAPAVVPGSVL